MQQYSAQIIRADHSFHALKHALVEKHAADQIFRGLGGVDADTAAPYPPGKLEEATITEWGSPVHRAPEAMQRPDAEWMEHFEDLLQYRDRIFEKHYPSAMLVT